jgi:hypothetical protein
MNMNEKSDSSDREEAIPLSLKRRIFEALTAERCQVNERLSAGAPLPVVVLAPD